MSDLISPDKYQKLIKDHRLIKSMKPSQFILWATSFYKTAFSDGRKSAYDELSNNQGIILPEGVDGYALDVEELYNILLSVDGINENIVNKVIEVIEELIENENIKSNSN